MSRDVVKGVVDVTVQSNIMDLKSGLASIITNDIRSRGLKQSGAAGEIGISNPRMSNLFNGHLEKFSIDGLIEILIRMGYRPTMDQNTIVLSKVDPE